MFGRYTTIPAKQSVSKPFAFTTQFEIGSDFFNFAHVDAQNKMGEIAKEFCPSRGIPNTLAPITPRSIPPQVNIPEWLSRLFILSRGGLEATSQPERFGILAPDDLLALEMLAEMTLEGTQSTVFLQNPFGVLYNTDGTPPPVETYSALDRFAPQRQFTTQEIANYSQALLADAEAQQMRGELPFLSALRLYRTAIPHLYGLVAPRLTASLEYSRERESGLTANDFNIAAIAKSI